MDLVVDQIANLVGLPREEVEVFVTNAYHRKAVIEWQL